MNPCNEQWMMIICIKKSAPKDIGWWVKKGLHQPPFKF